MDIVIGDRWEGFVSTLVETGRFESASDVVREGLRLVEERESRLRSLRETIDASIARGGSNNAESVSASLDRTAAELAGQGY